MEAENGPLKNWEFHFSDASRLIRRFAPEGVPRIETVRLDAPSLLFTLGVTALAALLVSLAPARRIARVDLRREYALVREFKLLENPSRPARRHRAAVLIP